MKKVMTANIRNLDKMNEDIFEKNLHIEEIQFPCSHEWRINTMCEVLVTQGVTNRTSVPPLAFFFFKF